MNINKNIFPIISFFEAEADNEFNYDNGKIKINSDENIIKNNEISFSLPSERILVKCLQYKKEKYLFFEKVISNENPNRIKPICKYFNSCGGCLYQNMNSEFYSDFKLKLLKKIFRNHDSSELNSIIDDIIVIPYGLRRKVNIEGLKKNNEIFLGFHRFSSRQIINIDSCSVIKDEISEMISELKILLMNILENFEKCEFFIAFVENGIDIGFEIHGKKNLNDKKKEDEIINFCKNNKNIIRFFFKGGKNSTIIYQNSLKENPYTLFGDYKVSIDAYSFMQTSKKAEQEILKAILSFFPENSKDLYLIDLFCGRGLYSLNFESYFSHIYAFELDDSAVSDFGAAILKYNLDKKITLFKHNLFLENILESFLNHNQFLIINPPRAGALEICKQIALSKIKPKHIVYISCNPNSFILDIRILLENNYRIEKIIPIDQFILTNHI